MIAKRLFDLFFSTIGLLLLLPLFLFFAIWIKIDSPGPVFFRQTRVGWFGRPFQIYKFRTMCSDAESKGRQITVGADPRITRSGQFLRRYKLDELPQLINVVKGEMSLVGPRPEVRKYVELFRNDYEEILTIKPGVTDLASLKYRKEALILEQAINPEEEYIRNVLPDKIRLAKEYLRSRTFSFDLALIFKTLLRLLL